MENIKIFLNASSSISITGKIPENMNEEKKEAYIRKMIKQNLSQLDWDKGIENNSITFSFMEEELITKPVKLLEV